MIVNVAESGTLELYWRHPVSRNPGSAKALAFLSALRRMSRAEEVNRTLFGGDWKRMADAIGRGECIVLLHRGECRWPGTHMPVAELSSSALVLLRSRTNYQADFGHALQWLRNKAGYQDLMNVREVLWHRYGRSSDPPPVGFADELEALLKSRELIALYHPLPVEIATVIVSEQAGAPPAQSVSEALAPEPATFSEINAPDQFAAVSNAAEAGAPFCEVCAAAAAANAAEKPKKESWIEVVLLDMEGQPVAGEAYEIKLPDGKVARGRTDANGTFRQDKIVAGQCSVGFPNLDRDAWEPL